MYRHCFLVTNFTLMSSFHLLISSLCTPCNAGLVPSISGVIEPHISGPNLLEVGSFEIQDVQISTQNEVAAINIFTGFIDDFDTWFASTDHVRQGGGVLTGTTNGPQDGATTSTEFHGRLDRENREENDTKSKFLVDNSNQNPDQVKKVFLSNRNKRKREDKYKSREIHQPKQLTMENHPLGDKIQASITSENQETTRELPFNEQMEFKIMKLDEKWDSLLGWVSTCLGNTDCSPVMKMFLLDFGDKITKINERIPCYNIHNKISWENCDIELIQHCNPRSCGEYFEFMIQPRDLRGKYKSVARSMEIMKIKLAEILEILVLFHGIYNSLGVSQRILGHQIENNMQDLVKWFRGIFLEETTDGLPLFGWFLGTLEEAQESRSRFKSMKISIANVFFKLQWRKVTFHKKAEIAFSLLDWWYRSKSDINLGGLDIKNNPTTYWDSLCGIMNAQREYFDKENIHKYEDKGKTIAFNHPEQLYFMHSLVTLLISRFEKRVMGITEEFKLFINNNLQDYLSRSQFDLFHEEMITLEGLPICIIPVPQPQGSSADHEVFVGLRGLEARFTEKKPKLRFLRSRIAQIFDFLDVLEIIALNITEIKLLSEHNDLKNWFLGVLFQNKSTSLPIFGWAKIKCPFQQLRGSPFGSVHKYVSMQLNKTDKQTQQDGFCISISVFRFWYEETTLNLCQKHPNKFKFPSSKEIMTSLYLLVIG